MSAARIRRRLTISRKRRPQPPPNKLPNRPPPGPLLPDGAAEPADLAEARSILFQRMHEHEDTS